MTSAYTAFPNDGVRILPRFLRTVSDYNGEVREENQVEVKEVISQQTARTMVQLLRGVVEFGTAQQAKILKQPVAGKTGTTNDFTDAWFVGFSPSLVAGVWVGFDDQRSLGDREAGATAALPIWVSYMKEALPLVPSASFVIPDDIVFAKIDPESGLLAPPGDEDAAVEVFVKGNEPTQYLTPQAKPAQFFQLDEMAN